MFASKQAFFSGADTPFVLTPLILRVDPSATGALPQGTFRIYITVPAGETATIDWDEGATDTVTGTGAYPGTEQTFTKTYVSWSNKFVKVTCPRYSIRFNDVASVNTSNTRRIISVTQWGTGKFTSAVEMFAYTGYAFTITATDTPDFSLCTSMVRMFGSATAFNQPLNSWNVSTVTDMQSMFASCSNFNQSLSNWNTSAVTNMREMFFGCIRFNQDISSWNTGAVTTMQAMFQSCTIFNQPIGSWNTGNVTNMTNMLQSASAFNADISGWNTAKVTNTSGMFQSSTAFNQPIGSWNMSNVTNMSNMFRSAPAFNGDISGWNVGKVTNMSSMFQSSTAFNQNLSSWVTGLTAQPTNFSLSANATWVANKATLFPFLSGGVTRINT